MESTLMPMLRNAAVAVFFLWIFVDGAMVFRHRTTTAENRDRHSLRLIMVGNLIAWVLGIGLAYGSFGSMRPAVPLQIAGFILMGTGIALRSAAILQLGHFHTPNVAVLQDHRVIDTGLYRHVRHPSYLGALIAFLGFSLAL
ncbi:MAG TPA: isoprenylcysteine carboxylmethyltransferase family protein, partial [Rhodanobacteraceae bacterium]|nr:isoprenylcysteine carboxylmethyltransferase family protein [Rhodanobacteraceae bacterium]